MKKTNNRNSALELLRMIATMGVIVLHYNAEDVGGGFGFVTPGGINQYYLALTETLFIVCVDVFVMLSAYFLSATQERRLSKVFYLLAETSFFRLIIYAVDCLTGTATLSLVGVLTKLLPIRYFVILYCVLYVISPYINVMLNRLSKRQFRLLLILSFLVFSVYSYGVDVLSNYIEDTVPMSPVGFYGSGDGYTIVNFTVLYLFGAYIRRYGLGLSRTKRVLSVIGLFTVMCGCVALALALSSGGINLAGMNYDSPLVILVSALLISLVSEVNFHSGLINELSGATFTCILIHHFFFRFVHIEYAVTRSLGYLVFHQLASVIVIFLCTYVVHKLWLLISGWFFRLVSPPIDRVRLFIPEDSTGADSPESR